MNPYRFSSHTARPDRPRRSCEKRGSKRLLCSDLVHISWSEDSSQRHAEIAILENLSLSGVGLFCGVKVPEGAVIELSTQGRSLRGQVKQCQFRENGYLVGVELDSESKWAQQQGGEFLPEHVLDVSLLEFD